MLAIDVIPDHVTRTEKKMHESALSIIVEEGDAIESALGETSFACRFLLRPRPWEHSQFLPDPESPDRCPKTMFTNIHKKITNHKSKLFFVIGNLLSPGLPLELEAEGYLGHEQSLLVGPLIPERSYYLAAQSDSKSLAGA